MERKRARDLVEATGRGKSVARRTPGKSVAAERAQWWDSRVEDKRGAVGASPLEGDGATESDCAAARRDESLRKELLAEEERK